MALLCDAIIGNVQEKSMKLYGAANAEVVLFSYAIGFCYIFAVMLITGGFMDGVEFFAQVSTYIPVFLCCFVLTKLFYFLESKENLWICIYFFFNWIFRNSSCSDFSQNHGSIYCSYCNYLSESHNNYNFICVLQQAFQFSVSIVNNLF